MNDNNDTRDRRDEVGILGYYKVFAVPMERNGALKVDLEVTKISFAKWNG